ncbi:MAG: hypothetical protein ACYS9X_31760, partial [Planctomycetota bacterium]
MRMSIPSCLLFSIPAFLAGHPDAHARRVAPGAGVPQRQAEELRVLREKLREMKGQLIDTGRARYVADLKGLQRRYAGHPVAPDILLALGEVHEDSPGKAIQYYARAARHAAGDRWAMTQQRALQRLARVYEGQRQYRKAVEALKK